MKNTGKLVMVALFLCGAFFTPSISQAATIDEQRVALIEQLITILQAKVAELVAQLEAQQTQITSINQPVFGSSNMPTQNTYSISVTPEFGAGSWNTREGDDRFREGMVRFPITGEYKKATIVYYETNKPRKISDAKMDLAPDGVHGYFQPDTEYTYEIDATNDVGQVAHVEGTFKTGKY